MEPESWVTAREALPGQLEARQSQTGFQRATHGGAGSWVTAEPSVRADLQVHGSPQGSPQAPRETAEGVPRGKDTFSMVAFSVSPTSCPPLQGHLAASTKERTVRPMVLPGLQSSTLPTPVAKKTCPRHRSGAQDLTLAAGTVPLSYVPGPGRA